MSTVNRVPFLPFLSTDKYQISSRRAKNIYDFNRLHHPLISDSIWQRKSNEYHAFVEKDRCPKEDIQLTPFEVVQEAQCISNILNQLGSREEILKKTPQFPLIPDHESDHQSLPHETTIEAFIPFIEYVSTSELQDRTFESLSLLSQCSLEQLEPFQIDPLPFIREDVRDTYLSLHKVIPDFPCSDDEGLRMDPLPENDSLEKYLSDMKEESRLREEIVEFVLSASNETSESLKDGNNNNKGIEEREDAYVSAIKMDKVVELEEECAKNDKLLFSNSCEKSSSNIDNESTSTKSLGETDNYSHKEEFIQKSDRSIITDILMNTLKVLPTKTTEKIVEPKDPPKINNKCNSSTALNTMDCKITEDSFSPNDDKPKSSREEKLPGEAEKPNSNKANVKKVCGNKDKVTSGLDCQTDAKESERSNPTEKFAETAVVVPNAKEVKDDSTHDRSNNDKQPDDSRNEKLPEEKDKYCSNKAEEKEVCANEDKVTPGLDCQIDAKESELSNLLENAEETAVVLSNVKEVKDNSTHDRSNNGKQPDDSREEKLPGEAQKSYSKKANEKEVHANEDNTRNHSILAPSDASFKLLASPGLNYQIDSKEPERSNLLEKAEETAVILPNTKEAKDDSTHQESHKGKPADFLDKCMGKSLMNQKPTPNIKFSLQTICKALLVDSNQSTMIEKANKTEKNVSINCLDKNKHEKDIKDRVAFSISSIENIGINNIGIKSKVIRRNAKESQVGTPKSIYFPQVLPLEINEKCKSSTILKEMDCKITERSFSTNVNKPDASLEEKLSGDTSCQNKCDKDMIHDHSDSSDVALKSLVTPGFDSRISAKEATETHLILDQNIKEIVKDSKNPTIPQAFSISSIQNIGINNIAIKSKIIRRNAKDSQIGTPKSIYFPQVQSEEVPSSQQSIRSPYFSSKKSLIDKERNQKSLFQVPFSLNISQGAKRIRLSQKLDSPIQSPSPENTRYPPKVNEFNPLDSFYQKGSLDSNESITNEYSSKKDSNSFLFNENNQNNVDDLTSITNDSFKESSFSFLNEKENESLTIECTPWSNLSNNLFSPEDNKNNRRHSLEKEDNSFSFSTEKMGKSNETPLTQKGFCFLSEKKPSSSPDEPLLKKNPCGLKRKIKRTKVFPSLNF